MLFKQRDPSRNIYTSTTNADMIQKLTSGKHDIFEFSDLASSELCEKEGLAPSQLESVRTLSGTLLWYGFHINVENGIVDSYKKALG